jgi:hypothetical protein
MPAPRSETTFFHVIEVVLSPWVPIGQKVLDLTTPNREDNGI